MSLLSENGIAPCLLDFDQHFAEDSPFWDSEYFFVNIPPSKTLNYYDVLSNIQKNLSRSNNLKKVLVASSTAVYPALNRAVIESDAQHHTSSRSGIDLLTAEEIFTKLPLQHKAIVIRFAGLFGPGRHPAHFFKSGKVRSPEAPVNMVHLDDCLNIILSLIESPITEGVFNACCPEHPSKVEFYTAACQKQKLIPPQFISSDNTYKIVSSKLLERTLAYQFKYRNPIDAL